MQETELCAREQVDVAMRRHLVILKVNLMIKLVTKGMFLASSLENTSKKSWYALGMTLAKSSALS